MPVALSGVMFGAAWPSGPVFFPLPARNRVLSKAMVSVERGAWHSPQCPVARTRYSPGATPEAGADGDAVTSHAHVEIPTGRKTLSNIRMVICFGVMARCTG